MLHLNFGLNFEALADDLITRLKAEWTDPFDPPVIIFPDLALEHWFKLKWMAQNRTLANLNTKFLDKFLFESLAGKPDENHPKFTRLSGELLRNMILAWLQMTSIDHTPNWQTLSDEVTNYIQTGDSSDETRLFDFATQMAKLFMEYETSRPGAFKTKEGLIQTWKKQDASDFFKKADQSREFWQRKLYQALFVGEDSVLAHINREIGALNIQYITLPQLYESCRTNTDNIDFISAPTKPVFIFWHAGMGQFYRVALHEYSNNHEVYAYVQNPCMEFWEDSTNKILCDKYYPIRKDAQLLEASDGFVADENPLLAKWGRAGRDNIKLWCASVDYDFDFHHEYKKFECNYSSDNTNIEQTDNLLHTIQTLVSKRKDNKETQSSDISLTITAAPTKIREVEHLHTQICHLLKDDKNKKGANIRDILIVAPDINAYRTSIYQVFGAERTQAEENKQKKRNHEAIDDTALYIPFTIIDGAARESLTARAIDALFRVITHRSLSRLEFFELVRNPLVQNVRGISSEEINAWEGWLTNMKVFRDREILTNNESIQYEDWKTGIKRLLLARLTDSRVQDNDDTLMPYADLESADSDSLCRFIDAIESLEEFIKKCADLTNGLSRDKLDDWFIPNLNSWISMSKVPRELSAESIIYQSVADSIEMLKYQYASGIENITWKCLEQTIRDAAEGSDYTTGSLFVNGLTFMNFSPNRIIPVKHVFFLGLDAASFPGRDTANSLDLRASELWPGDNQNAYKNRYAFLCQLMSTSTSIHLSYVNKNLQKDEDFYPSSIINDLLDFCHTQEQPVNTVPLDETRDIKDLFTKRAFRNKNIYTSMLENKSSSVKTVFERTIPLSPNDLPERVTLSKLKKYLNDPFQFQVGELLQTDEEIDPERIVYEPIDVDNIELLDTIKDLAQVFIKKTLEEISNEEALKQEDKIKNDFRQELRESGFRTASLYEELIMQKIVNGAENVANLMLTGNLVEADDDNAIDLIITQEVNNCTKNWHLQGQAEWHKWGPDTLDITSVMLGKSNECYRYLTAFVHALALILKKGREFECMNTEINVTIHLCGTEAFQVHTKTFPVAPYEAETLIERIYRYAYIEQFAKAAPMKLLEAYKNQKSGEIKTNIKNFIDLKEQLEDKLGPWQYFPKGKIFDLNTDIGYSAYNSSKFKEEWNAVKDQQLKLIEKLKPLRMPEENQVQQ